mmetsp:Transcript_9826/g.21897  ORF Transcript_9826/g.21897 Transcript_9826/m.21897 type:complete len:412 (+) Transcript_9826:547-1782(+)|eukprot:CAMPEP_0113306826 /NCGR_PEP_ID=MMETSP0010_2-20120614/5921_1 /TAXON_ID=216773 ORGANISM="Corethron hystrix, Strain 308" /NCGR_SAMPLE_ID=MMETSP0010_2 /ASSEMBLY_ACC=CAM_ASM_000155 /LENGTH=411 /DNA_ID=CAMNT_0000161569 /DNA_START=419 /DNA_END=1654 /DNA_ORIENTATION=- /assembly_acc=CAM_ASM_000155
MFHKRITFLVGPEAQAPFFTSGDDELSQQEVYGFMKPVFGKGVVYDATRKDRQIQFQSMANGLRASRLKSYVTKIEKECTAFFKTWGDEGTVDLLEALSELTILTASRCLHGDDVRENLFREVAKLFHDLDKGVTPITVFAPNLPTAAHRARDKARIEMKDLFAKVVRERRADPSKSGDGLDVLSIFMESKYRDGRPFSDDEITGLLIALLFAGQHTSCITSTWTALHIAKDKKVLQKLHEEQGQVLAGKKKLDYDVVNKMEFVHNCMRETLRLCPPLILLMRMALKDIPVSANGKKYTVPKGDIVMVSPAAAMRIPTVFPNPDDFDPDRFGPGREEHKVPYAYLGFGGGMHSCMGQNFAFLQVKIIMSILFRMYDIELVSGKMPDIDYEAMVVGPKGDCTIRYKRRHQTI